MQQVSDVAPQSELKLFRPEVVEAARRRIDGRVVLVAPLSVRVFVALISVAMLAALIFATVARFSRKESVEGWLTSSVGIVRSTATQGGRVIAISAREGQQVQAGQALAIIRLAPAIASGDSGAELAAALEREERATDDRRAVGEQRIAAQAVEFSNSRTALLLELGEAKHRTAIQQEQVKLAAAELSRAEEVAAKGYMARRDLDARRSVVLASEARLSELRTMVLGLERELEDIEAKARLLPNDLAALRAENEATKALLSQRKTNVTVHNEYVVVSPISGRVAALPIERGQTLATGNTVAVILPEDAKLEAQLFVPSRAITFVRLGQDVELKFDALPHEKFGVGSGEITAISYTVLEPRELNVPGLDIHEPVFRVRVHLSEEPLRAYGRPVPLRPGMLLNAEITVDRRSLLQWLLDPLYAAGHRR